MSLIHRGESVELKEFLGFTSWKSSVLKVGLFIGSLFTVGASINSIAPEVENSLRWCAEVVGQCSSAADGCNTAVSECEDNFGSLGNLIRLGILTLATASTFHFMMVVNSFLELEDESAKQEAESPVEGEYFGWLAEKQEFSVRVIGYLAIGSIVLGSVLSSATSYVALTPKFVATANAILFGSLFFWVLGAWRLARRSGETALRGDLRDRLSVYFLVDGIAFLHWASMTWFFWRRSSSDNLIWLLAVVTFFAALYGVVVGAFRLSGIPAFGLYAVVFFGFMFVSYVQNRPVVDASVESSETAQLESIVQESLLTRPSSKSSSRPQTPLIVARALREITRN